MSRRDIPRALARIVPLALLAGCGGSVDTAGFEKLACSANEQPLLLPGLQLPKPADYIELWEKTELVDDAPRLRESHGQKCKTAPDEAACLAAIAAAKTEKGFDLGQCVQVCSKYFLVVNRGSEVTVVDTRTALLETLGAIDAPNEAVIVALNQSYFVSCADIERGGVKKVGDGFEVIATRLTEGCDPILTTQYRVGVGKDGKATELESHVLSSESGCVGRRPPGLVTRAGRGATAAGAFFAEVAALEAASVHAFAVLRDELAAHGAPSDLIARADEARRDEIRHARVTAALARRFGGKVARPRIAPRRLRSLEALALDNAAEGCVRETFGAALGAYQASASRDAGVRRAMAPIARDEMRHGELSWAIDAWAQQRLGRRARAEMLEARREALRGVDRDAARAEDPALIAIAGMPGASAKRAMTDAFTRLVHEWDRG